MSPCLIQVEVLATKYSTNYRAGLGNKQIMANFAGNGAKSLHASVEASLKKLQTDYIDLVSEQSSDDKKKKGGGY